MSERILALDVGTNTVLGSVGEVVNGSLRILYDEERIVGLGRGVDRTQRLSPDRVQLALRALEEHVHAARALGAERFFAVGTSALRDALNREDFLAPAQALLGAPVEVISGPREAALTYLGRAVGLPPLRGPEVVIDIGGGSTEIVLGEGDVITERVSLDIGSVRLYERCLSSDPPTPSQLAALENDIADALARAPRPSGRTLLALAGTATSAAMLVRGRVTSQHGSEITTADIEALAEKLAGLTAAERRAMPGMIPARADVMVAGVRILSAIARWAGVERLVVSEGGVRHGVLRERLGV